MNLSHAEFGNSLVIDKENVRPTAGESEDGPLKAVKIKRDFFGRPVHTTTIPATEIIPDGTKIDASSIAKSTAFKGKAKTKAKGNNGDEEEGDRHGGRIWVSFHEGFSNAVRKPISLGDLLEGF